MGETVAQHAAEVGLGCGTHGGGGIFVCVCCVRGVRNVMWGAVAVIVDKIEDGKSSKILLCLLVIDLMFFMQTFASSL